MVLNRRAPYVDQTLRTMPKQPSKAVVDTKRLKLPTWVVKTSDIKVDWWHVCCVSAMKLERFGQGCLKVRLFRTASCQARTCSFRTWENVQDLLRISHQVRFQSFRNNILCRWRFIAEHGSRALEDSDRFLWTLRDSSWQRCFPSLFTTSSAPGPTDILQGCSLSSWWDLCAADAQA